MVAVITTTTIPWDFVAAVMKTGYYVELAGGGYSGTKEFGKAIRNVAANIPPHCDITFNSFYIIPNPSHSRFFSYVIWSAI